MLEAVTVVEEPAVERCDICGDKASGYHYNVLSCEGCKGFFRRSVQKSLNSICRFGGDCEVDICTRRKCPACRFQKCLRAGMQEACLLTAYQCRARGSKRRMSKLKSAASRDIKCQEFLPQDANINNGSTDCATAGWAPNLEFQPDRSSPLSIGSSESGRGTPPPPPYSPASSTSSGSLSSAESSVVEMVDITSSSHEFGASPSSHTTQISTELQALLSKIVFCQNKYERIAEEHIDQIQFTNMVSGDFESSEVRHSLYLRHAQLTVISTQHIIEFAKQMMNFTSFSVADQISLIKGSICNLLAVKMARRYDPSTDTIRLAEGHVYTEQTLQYAGLEECAPKLFRFCRTMAEMQTDNVEYGLLTCICLYSESGAVKDMDLVNQLQDIYSRALEAYCDFKTGDGCRRFARLIMKIINLRELNMLHSEYKVSVKMGIDERNSVVFPEPLQDFFSCSTKASHRPEQLVDGRQARW